MRRRPKSAGRGPRVLKAGRASENRISGSGRGRTATGSFGASRAAPCALETRPCPLAGRMRSGLRPTASGVPGDAGERAPPVRPECSSWPGSRASASAVVCEAERSASRLHQLQVMRHSGQFLTTAPRPEGGRNRRDNLSRLWVSRQVPVVDYGFRIHTSLIFFRLRARYRSGSRRVQPGSINDFGAEQIESLAGSGSARPTQMFAENRSEPGQRRRRAARPRLVCRLFGRVGGTPAPSVLPSSALASVERVLAPSKPLAIPSHDDRC